MNEVQRQLVEVYSAGPVEEVHQGAAYQNLCAKHRGDRAFDGERTTIEDLRVRIDKYVGQRGSYREQVEFALRLVRNLRDPKRPSRPEACRELVIQSYGRSWPPEHQQYFVEKAAKIAAGVYYFLSFTNRNPNKPAHNLVNRDHRHFIIDAIGPQEYAKRDQSAENLAARAVHCLLSRPFPGGFYFPEHLEDNRIVAAKLMASCERSLAFVQLVQQEMFTQDPATENWCHREYSWAQGNGPNNILFVQLDEKIRVDPVFDDWRDSWYCSFDAGDPVKLTETRWEDPLTIDTNIQKITRGLTAQIDRVIDGFYLGVPA